MTTQTVTVESQTQEQKDPFLFGHDTTTGIVSVKALSDGTAKVWRRINAEQVVREDDTFYPWLLISDPAAFEDIPPIPGEEFAGIPNPGEHDIAVFELRGDAEYKYLVVARSFADIERRVLAHTGAERLWDLRDKVYYRPPTEQYLMQSGKTYFKGMVWTDIRRLQLDIETTSLSPANGSVFIVSLRDSSGWERTLDVARCGGERELLLETMHTIRERDPDVIEGHNIFAFDLPFLSARCRINDVPLLLGRDDSEPVESRDVLKVGARTERITRFGIAGREVTDTLHAVKRRDAIVHDIRSYGLKDSARYFGLATDVREYVEGPEIYETWKQDPDRVLRYALDDVREVDGLSGLLMGSSFALASMVPKTYERVAIAGTGQGLIEPLLVRAYLTARQSIPRNKPGASDIQYVGGYTRMYRSGIISHVVKADAASLYPSIMLAQEIAPAGDTLRIFPKMLHTLTDLRLLHKRESRNSARRSREYAYHEAMQGAMKILINSFYGSMGAEYALFGDIRTATHVTEYGQTVLRSMMQALDKRNMELIEADTDGVYFTVPDDWTLDNEMSLIAEINRDLPKGITVEHDGRYKRMYSYQEKNYILQEYDGPIRLVGAAFRNSRNEPYGERFFNEALPLMLELDFDGLRACYERYIVALRNRELPIEDVCVNVQLTKSEEEYRNSPRTEEQYKVLITAKRHWNPGDRVRYYHATSGRKGSLKLYTPGARDYDSEYYVKKLRNTFAARLAKAFSPEDFNSLFGEMRGLFDAPPSSIKPIVTVEATLQ